MQREDIIETHLTVNKPCSIPDYDQYCLNELRRIYEGKCFRGKFVLTVERLIDRSSVVINAAPIGTATISVKFEAKTITYPPGTILTNCVVTKIDQTRRIMLLKDNVGIFINRDKRLLSLKQGHIINVKVGDSRYPINTNRVAVKAVPYIFPDADNKIYQIDMAAITEEEMNILHGLQIDKNSKIPVNLWKMFYMMYYPYQTEPKTPKNVKRMDIFKLPKKKVFIQRPNSINEADADVFLLESQPDDSAVIIEESAFVILDMILKRVRNHIILIEEMCHKFEKESIRSKNKAVWLIHNKLKTPSDSSNKKVRKLELNSKKGAAEPITRTLDETMPRLPYEKGRAEKLSETVMAWGQKKLLLSEIEFLTLFGNLSDTVVYAGSAPGTHISIISELFPKHKLILYDPRDFAKSLKLHPQIKTHKEYFTDKTAKMFENQNILFISDIRRGSSNDDDFEKTVAEDMEMQRNWVKIIKPELSMLKFRLPYKDGNTEYFDGDIYLQAYAPLTSTETRLITNGSAVVKYDNKKYEEQLSYFNVKIRTTNYDKKCEQQIYKLYTDSEYNINLTKSFDVKSLKLKINRFLCKNYLKNDEPPEDPKYAKIWQYCHDRRKKFII